MPTIDEYKTLATLTETAREAMQAAYHYARDTRLHFEMPSIVRDEDDRVEESWETSWEESEC